MIIKIYSAFGCLRFSIFHNSFQLTTKKRRSTCQPHSNLQSTPQAAKSMQFMYSAPGRRSIISSTSTRYPGTSCQRKNRSWASGALVRWPFLNYSLTLFMNRLNPRRGFYYQNKAKWTVFGGIKINYSRIIFNTVNNSDLTFSNSGSFPPDI